MSISRRDALLGASAAVAVAGVPTAVAAQACDTELVALGQQWRELYIEWLRCPVEEENTVLLKRVHAIEDRMEEIPARSPNGALVKLRVAAEHYRLMGDIDGGDHYALLTYQAWQALETEPFDFERLMRGLPS